MVTFVVCLTLPYLLKCCLMSSPDFDSHSFVNIDSTDFNLLKRSVMQEEGAWQELVQRYTPVVFQWAKRIGAREEDAADVAQTVMINLYRRLSSFDPERENASFRSWLWAITRNALYDKFRRDNGKPVGQGGSAHLQRIAEVAALTDSTVSHFGSSDELEERLHQVLLKIQIEYKESTWNAFWLTTVENHTSAEAGEALGISKAAVRMAKARVLKRLRDEMTIPSDGSS